MRSLYYKSSLEGKASLLFWCFVWGAALAIVAELGSVFAVPEKPYDTVMLAISTGLLYTLSFGFLTMFAITLIYGWRTTEFEILGGGQTAVYQSYYDFLFSRVIEERVFDKIISIRLEQAAIDLMLGSGTLVLTVVNFAGSDSAKSEIRIPHVSRVEFAKREIMASQPRGAVARSSNAPQYA